MFNIINILTSEVILVAFTADAAWICCRQLNIETCSNHIIVAR